MQVFSIGCEFMSNSILVDGCPEDVVPKAIDQIIPDANQHS